MSIVKLDHLGRPDYTEPWDFKVPEIPTFEETESGRRRRGELEIMVDYAIKEWIVADSDGFDLIEDYPPFPDECTCEYIAKRCEELDGRSTSSASVWKILAHFEQMGYIDVGDNPKRFLGFTQRGLVIGYRQLLEEHKRNKKREKRLEGVRSYNRAVLSEKVRKMK